MIAPPMDASILTLAPSIEPKTIAEPTTRAPTFHELFHPGVELVIEFDAGSSLVPSEAQAGLDLVARSLADFPRSIRVNGDARPPEGAALALARARTVTAELMKRGVSVATMTPEIRVREQQPWVRFFEDEDLGPLELSRERWESCCSSNNNGTQHVHFTLSDLRADSKEGRAAYKAEEAKCAACNGKWGPRGLAGFPGCDCKYDDGGKACSSPSDCKGRCDVGWEGAMQQHGITCPHAGPCALHGWCEEFATTFGCHGWIDFDVNNGERKTRWICVD